MKRSLLLLVVTSLMSVTAHSAPFWPVQVGKIVVGGFSLPLFVVSTPTKRSSQTLYKPPAIDYHITAYEAEHLAVYTIPGEAVLLAPKGWQVTSAPSVGTDGNFFVRMDSPSAPSKDWLSLSSIPACQGCAYGAARSWLPWVKRESYWCGNGLCNRTQKPGLRYARLQKDVTAVSYDSKYGKRINGLVEYSPHWNNTSHVAYESEWFCAPALGHKVATAVLNFLQV